MAKIFGKEFTKTELLQRVGNMSQLAGIRQAELTNGNEKGVKTLEFFTGTGFQFSVIADRAMDILNGSFQGNSLSWHTPNGAVAPAFYDRHDIGWLWNYAGGLMVTCGLTQVGQADEDEGEELGLHGRVSNIPAKNVCTGAEWEGDEYVIWATGEMREARLFGPNLVLKRSIYTKLGKNAVWIEDEVENQGYEESPLMVLYHCNMGFPVVDDGSELLAVINNMEPRDDDAADGADIFDTFEAPTANYTEQCFYIDHDKDVNDKVNVALVNRKFDNDKGIGVYLSYHKKEMPYYTQWKMMGKGEYVVGMEPGNCIPEGRTSARKRGALKTLQPGEKQKFHLEIGVLPSNNEIRTFEAKLRGITE